MMSPQKIFLKSTLLLLLTLTSYFLLPTPYFPAFAQEPDYDRVNEIAKKLNCPTCAGINLADCRTLTCEQWRDQINDLVKQGFSDDDVLNYFTTRYGSQVLQEPPKSGPTLFLWILPVIVLLAGGVWLILALRGWSRPEPASLMASSAFMKPASDTPQPPSHYLSQVEKDLNRGD
ncbi:MAG: cytochrome c-type biogenesis protein CcmH [Chloroflexi bacterium]|nr:cytochrome c-type biogenesis protein CcmH [Chloroflexota bacterium]